MAHTETILLKDMLCKSVFLVRLKEHMRNANVPGLGLGGLEEIDYAGVLDSLNERP